MIEDTSLQWISTALFVFAAAYCIYAIANARRSTVRVDHVVHLAMCIAMIAMAWQWGMRIPTVPQGIFFVAATAWFAVSAARSRTSPIAESSDQHSHGPVLGLYHAAMMAAMVWMLAVMGGWLPGVSAHHESGDSSTSGADMAGMDMAGMDMSSHTQLAAPQPGWVSAVSIGLTVAFAAAAIVWLHKAFVNEQSVESVHTRPVDNSTVAVVGGSRVRTVAAACEVAMAAGMAIMMASV
jgi:hypothetical protein